MRHADDLERRPVVVAALDTLFGRKVKERGNTMCHAGNGACALSAIFQEVPTRVVRSAQRLRQRI